MIREKDKIYYKSQGYGMHDKSKSRVPSETEKEIKRLNKKIHNCNKELRMLNLSLKYGEITESDFNIKRKSLIEEFNRLIENYDRYCGENLPPQKLKKTYKKLTDEKLEVEILRIIEKSKEKGYNWLTKEDVANHLHVKESQVEKIFMKLNRDGILSQPQHRAPHDSNRDPIFGFGDCKGMWKSDIYTILNKEEIEDD